MEAERQSSSPFPTSQWTLIVRAKGEGPEAQAALEQLIRHYFKFLIWLMRVNRHPPDLSAEELANEYLLGVLRRKDIEKLDRNRGSFHGWLRTSVKHFLFNEWDKWRKRALTDTTPFEVIEDSMPEENLCDRVFMTQLI